MLILQHLAVLLVCVVLNCNRFSEGAIRLNPNGGYDIVIGVDSSVPEPINDRSFFDNMMAGIEQFSEELWNASKQRFFINSVDIVVPVWWWTVSIFNISTWQSVDESEIRISHGLPSPIVVNPNACGVPGLYVNLPSTFFNPTEVDNYGSVGRALVNLWARYRFGVWEEHGTPGDTNFPYFYNHPSFSSKWEATGCSNEPLIGSYRTVEGETASRCDPSANSRPEDDCRFVPSPTKNTATSSLLHMQWLPSVSEFCDDKTHNYAAPNRQNWLCGHKSIWEVIRESDDYKRVRNVGSLKSPEFRIMKESRHPDLYILVDGGRTATSVPVTQELMGAIMKSLSFPTLERINVAVGTYPNVNIGKGQSYVKAQVDWSPISSVISIINRVLEEVASSQEGPVIRDFGLAIQEVAEKIKQRNHLAGTLVLVVKRGAGPNTFDQLSYEQEVIASLREDNRIKVYAIETDQGDETPYANLETVVDKTAGKYFFLNGTTNVAKRVEPLLDNMQEILEQPSIMNSLTSWTIQKQFTQPNQQISIGVHDNTGLVRVHLITDRHMSAANITLFLQSDPQPIPIALEKAEWNENSDMSRRLVFSYNIRTPQKGSMWTLSYTCNSRKSGNCNYFLIVTAEHDTPSPRINEITPKDVVFTSKLVNIDVSTSAPDNYLDMSYQGVKNVPFAIYGKIEIGQKRVLDLQNVTALVRFQSVLGNTANWLVPLEDDGKGLADVQQDDGIYSGVFTPTQDGRYKISVRATGNGEGDVREVKLGGLLPKDQVNFGCTNSTMTRCLSVVPTEAFARVQDLNAPVVVENAATFKPGKPMKILDFRATNVSNYAVEFTFTSPKLLGSNDQPDEYRIYMAPHADNFVDSTDLTKLIIQLIGQPSGQLVKFKYNEVQRAIVYYAVEAMYKDQKGGPSNVVGIVTSM